MSNLSPDEKETLWILSLPLWIYASIFLVLGFSAVLSNIFWYQPLLQSGYNKNVSGLISEFCSPDYKGHREDLLTQINGTVNGSPDRAANLPTVIKQQIIDFKNKRYIEGCNLISISYTPNKVAITDLHSISALGRQFNYLGGF